MGRPERRWRWHGVLLVVAMVLSACAGPERAPSATTDAAVTPTTEPTVLPQGSSTAEATAVSPTAVSPTAVAPTATVVPTAIPPTPTPAPTAVPTPEPVLTGAQLAPALAMSSLDETVCPDAVAAAGVRCMIARLPLDALEPNAAEMVEIMIAQVDNGDPNGVGPVVFLQGGPGVASTPRAQRFVGGQHDMIYFDQRGTGFSLPKLACPETAGLFVAEHTDNEAERLAEDNATYFDAYQTCHDRLLDEGVDFDHFNTQASALDLELIRQLFEFDRWTIWGISYGTRLALTLMRDHPTGIRGAVLDSVVPFEVDFFATIPEHGIRSFLALDAACADDACVDDHGAFFDELSSLVRRLDESPVVVQVTRPVTGETFPFRVDGSELLSMAFTQMYSTGSLPALPRQVARADFGGLDEIVNRYMLVRDPNRLDLSIGMYYATWCREEYPFHDPSVDDATLDEFDDVFGDAIIDALASDGIERICTIFDVEASLPIDDEPVVSAIPAVVFAGAFDPITPPAWSQSVAQTLSDATYIEMPNHGHGMSTDCPAEIRLAFLIDPGADLDLSCVAATDPPDFE